MEVSNRVVRLRKTLLAVTPMVCPYRAKIFTRVYQETENDPSILRRAKAVAACLDEIPVTFEPDELIVGNRSPHPRAGVVSPEMATEWLVAELPQLSRRSQDPFIVDEQTKTELINDIIPYWRGRSMKDRIRARIPKTVEQAIDSGLFHLNQTDKGQGHIIPDYTLVLKEGLGGLLAKTEDLANQPRLSRDQILFYQASVIALQAATRFGLRYAGEVEREISVLESSGVACTQPQRVHELRQMAANLRWVPNNPPRSFWEALQALWLTYVILQMESNASSISFGRLDQYLNPFLQNDLANGLSEQRAQELLDCFFVKANHIVAIRSSKSARHFAGFPINPCITLGGQDHRGADASNKLTMMCLTAIAHVGLPQPNVALRVHSRLDPAVLALTGRVIQKGFGLPHLYNDEVAIPALRHAGVLQEDACDYAIVGCVELSIPGKTYGLHDIALFNAVRCLELAIQEGNGKQEAFHSFLEFKERVHQAIAQAVKQMAIGANHVESAHAQSAPTPLLSALVDECLQRGRDVTRGGAVYNFSGVQLVGLANLADSLAAVQWACFSEGPYPRWPWTDVVAMLDGNFVGRERDRQAFRNHAPKFGNDHDEVDRLAAEFVAGYCHEVAKQRNRRGGRFTAGVYCVSANVPLGQEVGATPDGRKASVPLADGGMSPCQGLDRRGPTSVLKSVGRVDQAQIANGSLLNLRFGPGSFAGKEGNNRFLSFVKAWRELKVMQLQFNVVGQAQLRQAQRNPDAYRDLVVRVAGYSAFFVDLDPSVQDDIMNRTVHK